MQLCLEAIAGSGSTQSNNNKIWHVPIYVVYNMKKQVNKSCKRGNSKLESQVGCWTLQNMEGTLMLLDHSPIIN